jgi:pyrroline-5-carboxylate reductase
MKGAVVVMQLGLIGGGVMGEALLAGAIAAQVYDPSMITVSEPSSDRQAFLSQTYGVQVTGDNAVVLQGAQVVLLAIKPQIFAQIGATLQGAIASRSGQPPLVLSILAGTTLAQLEVAFPGCPVVRAMPNTPATVRAGMTALAAGSLASPEHVDTAQRLFAAVGETVTVPEGAMDAVTGLAGSGPGYLGVIVEALADGGVSAGLPRDLALKLAVQTLYGTGCLLRETGLHPAQLKDRVTSPGGTTIAGVAAMESRGVRSAMIEAVRASWGRSRELGQG